MDALIGLFEKFASLEERRLSDEVRKRGGLSKARNDEEVLKALLVLDSSISSESSSQADDEDAAEPGRTKSHFHWIKNSKPRNTTTTVDELESELREDVDDALTRNMDTFGDKFELQVSVLVNDIATCMRLGSKPTTISKDDGLWGFATLRGRDPTVGSLLPSKLPQSLGA